MIEERGTMTIKLGTHVLTGFNAAVEAAVQQRLASMLEDTVVSRKLEDMQREYEEENRRRLEREQLEDERNAVADAEERKQEIKDAMVAAKKARRTKTPEERAVQRVAILLYMGKTKHGYGEGSHEYRMALREAVQRCYVVGISTDAPVMRLAVAHLDEMDQMALRAPQGAGRLRSHTSGAGVDSITNLAVSGTNQPDLEPDRLWSSPDSAGHGQDWPPPPPPGDLEERERLSSPRSSSSFPVVAPFAPLPPPPEDAGSSTPTAPPTPPWPMETGAFPTLADDGMELSRLLPPPDPDHPPRRSPNIDATSRDRDREPPTYDVALC